MLKGIETVTVYLSQRRQKEYYDYIVSLSPKRVIFNPGSENYEFETLLEAHGIEVLHACTLVMLRANTYAMGVE